MNFPTWQVRVGLIGGRDVGPRTPDATDPTQPSRPSLQSHQPGRGQPVQEPGRRCTPPISSARKTEALPLRCNAPTPSGPGAPLNSILAITRSFPSQSPSRPDSRAVTALSTLAGDRCEDPQATSRRPSHRVFADSVLSETR